MLIFQLENFEDDGKMSAGRIGSDSARIVSDEIPELFQKPADIRQPVLNNPEELRVIDIPINMHQAVPEPGHLNQHPGYVLSPRASLR